MKKLVLMMVMVVSCVFASQYGSVQAGPVQKADREMLNVKNFYPVDIVDVDLSMQEAIYNAYENCLIKEVYKSNGNSPIQYKVFLETTDQRHLVVAFDESGHVLDAMPENEYQAARKKN